MPLQSVIRRLVSSTHNNDDQPRSFTVISSPIEQSFEDLDSPDISTHKQQHGLNSPGFQVMSDLHLERTLNKDGSRYKLPFSLRVTAPYLILAGDIVRFCDDEASLDFFRGICEKYERVFFVAGNHEFYGSSREGSLQAAKTLASELGERFAYMDRTEYELADHNTIILGCTLYSHIMDRNDVAFVMDFQRVTNWTVEAHNAAHQEDLKWLLQGLKDLNHTRPNTRVIVITHFAPAFEKTSHPRQEHNRLRTYFCSNTAEQYLQSLDGPDRWPNVTWVFGHTHYNAHYTMSGMLLYSNQPHDKDCRRKFDPQATM